MRPANRRLRIVLNKNIVRPARNQKVRIAGPDDRRQHRKPVSQKIRGPDLETTPYPEALQVEFSVAVEVVEKQTRDQKSRQYEEQIDTRPPDCLNEIEYARRVLVRKMTEENEQHSEAAQKIE